MVVVYVLVSGQTGMIQVPTLVPMLVNFDMMESEVKLKVGREADQD